jgi:tRNA nucleotidyltransferase (CCA-adding enzyme)
MNNLSAVMHILSVLKASGETAYMVGGCVRDQARGAEPKDWDICTSAHPEKVLSLFPDTVPTGVAFGTVTVMTGGVGYEVTTMRRDGVYADGRRPTEVEYTRDICEDLARRDFTINAMALDDQGAVIDPFGGLADLRQGLIRAVGVPTDRFREDGLRILRAVRFAAQFNYKIEANTYLALGSCLDMLGNVSKERIRDETVKILVAPHVEGLKILMDTGIFRHVCPPALAMRDCGQNHYHDWDVWGHTLQTIAKVRRDPILRLAAFLHDIGKPLVKKWDEKRGEHSFLEHEDASVKIADAWLTDMKFSNEIREKVLHLVGNHMYTYVPHTGDAAIRRFIRRIGAETLDDFFELRRADQYGTHVGGATEEDLVNTVEFQKRCEEQKQWTPARSQAIAVDGNDVMAILGVGPGRRVGAALKQLMELVLDDPANNTREILLGKIGEMHEYYGQRIL